MSYLSTTENVGFSGIPQNISDASCATQYKMAVDGVPGSCSEVNMFIHDSSGDEQTYITHLNDNYFHSKFKIDPNELYTFHDSDIIAGEITVSHTEDNFIFSDNDIKTKLLDSPSKEVDLIGSLTNGEVKEEIEIKKEPVSNGHYEHFNSVKYHHDVKSNTSNIKDSKTSNTKVPKAKTQSQSKESTHANTVVEIRRQSVHSPKGHSNNATAPICSKASIISDKPNLSTSNAKCTSTPKLTGSETFLDVFKREQGLVESPPVVVKTELPCPAAPAKTPVPTAGKTSSAGKTALSTAAKIPAAAKKTPTAGKTLAVKTAQAKPRRGRGPAVHEALQRIPATKKAVPQPVRSWHAPGDELFQCGPLDNRRPLPFTLESSSSDDDHMPDFEAGTGSVCVEESAAESRGARLALRRAALRRHVARAHTALRLATHYRGDRALAKLVKKQLRGQGPSCRVPTETVNQLLAKRGMPSVLTSQERRTLRESGWSGGESGSMDSTGSYCAEERCTKPSLPCARYCLSHVTLDPEQRLYAACAAVFAGGSRCMQPLLPLQDQTPLCAEHAWKRDNYDKISRDSRPKKPAPRKRPWPPPPRAPRKAVRRRRPPPRPKPAQHDVTSEINVCSNSSTYDSSEDTTMGALSETEYITTAGNSHELEVEVGPVPPDDILDPAVLSQIPDEAFTEFFNQAEGGAAFAESSELAAALEAVLDERALDSIADCLTPHPHPHHAAKVQQVPAVSMQSSAPS